jgi:hypothetical protein
MKINGEAVTHVSISYKYGNRKHSITCSFENANKVMNSYKDQGATDVKILHYFGSSGRIIDK